MIECIAHHQGVNETRGSGRREETSDLVSSNNLGNPGDYLIALTRVTLNLGTESDCKSRTWSPKCITLELPLLTAGLVYR